MRVCTLSGHRWRQVKFVMGGFAVCHYCGCREIPLLRDYIAEHERAINHGGEAVRALDRGEHRRARELLSAMAEELRSHWRGEENGLFPAALTSLDGDEWDTAMAAWQEAHPGRSMIAYG